MPKPAAAAHARRTARSSAGQRMVMGWEGRVGEGG